MKNDEKYKNFQEFPQILTNFRLKYSHEIDLIEMASSERANIKVMFARRHTVFIENIERFLSLAYNTSIHTRRTEWSV